MSQYLTWYVARASGIVAWGILVASMLWGILYATRVLGRRPAPWWLLGVHRFLGALAVVFTAVHVGALMADRYVDFGLTDVLVPFTGAWRPGAVGLGIVAMYLLVAIELTSLAKRRLPARLWRGIHLGSYVAFAFGTVHALTAGTDARDVVAPGLGVALGVVAVSLAAVGLTLRTEGRRTGTRVA